MVECGEVSKGQGKIYVMGDDGEQREYFLPRGVQIYHLHGVNINDKHLDTISRQMMRRVKVEDIGDTEFLPEKIVETVPAAITIAVPSGTRRLNASIFQTIS